MDNDIMNVESGVKNSLAGRSEMAEEMLWVENSVNKLESMKKAAKRAKKDEPTPEEIREDVEYQNEVYEEFSSDFDGLEDYDNIEDESAADNLEAAADMHVDCPYSHTANYTMILDPENDDSIASTSQS